MTVSRNQRHLRRTPCPVCGGGDDLPRGQGRRCEGFTSHDGWVHCARPELAGTIEQGPDGLYSHRPAGLCRCGFEHAPSTYDSGIEAVYRYRDEHGEPAFEVVRKTGKRFLQRRHEPGHADADRDGWVWKTAGMRMILYRLPELLAADPQTPIVVCEGEKDADAGARAGLETTCNPRGAGKWSAVAELARKVLEGRSVVIVADKDAPGRAHAAQVKASLNGSCVSVRVLEVPGDGKDLADYLGSGGDPVALLAPPRIQDFELELEEEEPEEEDTGEAAERGVTARTSELHNAERLLEMHADDLRYVGAWRLWLAWDGKRWQEDRTGAALRCVIDTHKRILAEALDDAEEATRAWALNPKDADLADAKAKADKMLAWAITSQSARRLDASLTIARSFEPFALDHQQLDADPWILNVGNGTVDLRTGQLRPHRRADLCTKLAPVDFDPAAKCPLWDAFVDRAMGGDAELVAYLRRIVGYALTGVIAEHVLGFLFGGGANGKTTWLVTLFFMLGEYAAPAPRGLLFQTKGERHPTELASLHGRRFVTCSEIGAGQAFDEALVKDLTGGDVISARRMREDFWTFAPTHKLFIAGNYRPTVNGDDEGIWRRIRLIPWTVTIPVEERDKDLPAKLRSELPGILAWGVRGCLEWQARGLGDPPAVVHATTAYRSESDTLGEFFRAALVFVPSASIARAALRKRYVSWCEEAGYSPVGARKLAERLRREGATDADVRTAEGTREGWRGVRFATPTDLATRVWASGDRDLSGPDPGSSSTRARGSQTNGKSHPTSTDVPTGDDDTFAGYLHREGIA